MQRHRSLSSAGLAVTIALCALPVCLMAGGRPGGGGSSPPHGGRTGPQQQPGTQQPGMNPPIMPQGGGGGVVTVVDPEAAADAVSNAVTGLERECQAYNHDPQGHQLRSESSYFADNPSEAVTPDAVLDALSKPVPGDAAQQAYVKWQLLSAIHGKFEGSNVAKAIAVYQNSPNPQRNPGLNFAQIDRAIELGNGHEAAARKSEADFQRVMDRYNIYNKPIINYRDELFDHLPSESPAIAIGLKDLSSRLQLGAPTDRLATALAAAIHEWSADASPQDRRAVAEALNKICTAASVPAARPYSKLEYQPGPNRLLGDSTFDVKPYNKLKALAQSLAQGGPNHQDQANGTQQLKEQ